MKTCVCGHTETWHAPSGCDDCNCQRFESGGTILPPPPEPASRFEEIGANVGKLVAGKQAAYGDSFGRAGQVLRELYPTGIAPAQYDELLTIARVLDKLFRVATDKDAYGESPWQDIAGYALLALARNKP